MKDDSKNLSQVVALFILLLRVLPAILQIFKTAAARGAPRHDQQRDGWGLRRQRSIQGVC